MVFYAQDNPDFCANQMLNNNKKLDIALYKVLFAQDNPDFLRKENVYYYQMAWNQGKKFFFAQDNPDMIIEFYLGDSFLLLRGICIVK